MTACPDAGWLEVADIVEREATKGGILKQAESRERLSPGTLREM